jgi:hypothetical protein
LRAGSGTGSATAEGAARKQDVGASPVLPLPPRPAYAVGFWSIIGLPAAAAGQRQGQTCNDQQAFRPADPLLHDFLADAIIANECTDRPF